MNTTTAAFIGLLAIACGSAEPTLAAKDAAAKNISLDEKTHANPNNLLAGTLSRGQERPAEGRSGILRRVVPTSRHRQLRLLC